MSSHGRIGQRRWLLVPSSLLALLLLLSVAGSNAAGLTVLVVLVLGLVAVVGWHRSLYRGRRGERVVAARGLQTPGQTAVAVLIVVVFGGVAALLTSTMVAAAAPSLTGDGSQLVKLALLAFVLVPCMAIGFRCGCWWAFLGGVGLVSILLLCVLISATDLGRGMGLAIVSVTAVSFAVAVGSLQRQLARAASHTITTRSTIPAETSEPRQQRMSSAISSVKGAGVSA